MPVPYNLLMFCEEICHWRISSNLYVQVLNQKTNWRQGWVGVIVSDSMQAAAIGTATNATLGLTF
jgi:hypothetical protein